MTHTYVTNPTVPASINNWDVAFDPHGYAKAETWAVDLPHTEDLLQLHHVYLDLVIDLGCYDDVFVLLVVKNEDWSSPVERIELDGCSRINAEVNRVVEKYVN